MKQPDNHTVSKLRLVSMARSLCALALSVILGAYWLYLATIPLDANARILMENGRPGEWCYVEFGLPYLFQNVGKGTLSVHRLHGEYYLVWGKGRLLPAGKTCSYTVVYLPNDEGTIGRELGPSAKVNWGSLPEKDSVWAREALKFCRAVAQFEARQPVTEYETVNGEPARWIYHGKPEGACGAFRSNLMFQLLGTEYTKLYQLKPSGRFRVFGTVKVVPTGEVCKNGWIDKYGHVISTE